MADLEGLTRVLLSNGLDKEEILKKLQAEYLFYKKIPSEKAVELAEAVFREVQNSNTKVDDQLVQDLLDFPKTNWLNWCREILQI